MPPNFRRFGLKTQNFRLSAASPVSIHEPSVFSASDVYGISGFGFGTDDDVPVKAIGEYLERHVAFRLVKPEGRANIADMGLSSHEEDSLLAAMLQTRQKTVTPDETMKHEYSVTTVRRLGSKDRCLYPSVFFSLHDADEPLDASIVPVRDSSGSSIHPLRDVSYRAALLEFAERQCLTAMWVSRRCNEVSDVQDFDGTLDHVRRQMLLHGSIKLYDISFLKGAKVIFAAYQSGQTDRIVNFACGGSADFSQRVATSKALIEMWQTSLLLTQIAFFGTRDYGSTKLKEDFQSANRPDFDLGLAPRPVEVGTSEAEDVGDLNLGRLESSIMTVSKNVYVYEMPISVSGTVLWFCRVISPDFFVHMSPGEANNNNNKWVDLFCDKADRRLEPLPFS